MLAKSTTESQGQRQMVKEYYESMYKRVWLRGNEHEINWHIGWSVGSNWISTQLEMWCCIKL